MSTPRQKAMLEAAAARTASAVAAAAPAARPVGAAVEAPKAAAPKGPGGAKVVEVAAASPKAPGGAKVVVTAPKGPGGGKLVTEAAAVSVRSKTPSRDPRGAAAAARTVSAAAGRGVRAAAPLGDANISPPPSPGAGNGSAGFGAAAAAPKPAAAAAASARGVRKPVANDVAASVRAASPPRPPRAAGPAAAAAAAAAPVAAAAAAPVAAIFNDRTAFKNYVLSRLGDMNGKTAAEKYAVLMASDSYHDFKGARAQDNEYKNVDGTKTSYCFDALADLFDTLVIPAAGPRLSSYKFTPSPGSSAKHKQVQAVMKLKYDINWTNFEHQVRIYFEKSALKTSLYGSPGVGTIPTNVKYTEILKAIPYKDNALFLIEDEVFKSSPPAKRDSLSANIGERLIKWFFQKRKSTGEADVALAENFSVGFSFDAKTSVIKNLVRPLNKPGKIHAYQYITPQNFLDSANTNFDVMTFNGNMTFDGTDTSRNKFTPSLTLAFNNFFTSDKADFKIDVKDSFLDDPRKFEWKAKLATEAADINLPTLYKDKSGKDKHRNGPSVKFLSQLIIDCNRKPTPVQIAECYAYIAGLDKNYTMVNPKPVADKMATADLNKLIFDLKRFGDHEQANAVLWLNLNGQPTVFVTGDILSALYSRIIGNPTIYVNSSAAGGDDDDEEEEDAEGEGGRSMLCYRGREFVSDPLRDAQNKVNTTVDSINYIISIYTRLCALAAGTSDLDLLEKNLRDNAPKYSITSGRSDELRALQKLFLDLKIANALKFLTKMKTTFAATKKIMRDGIEKLFTNNTLNPPIAGAMIDTYSAAEDAEITAETGAAPANPKMAPRTKNRATFIKEGINFKIEFAEVGPANAFSTALETILDPLSAKIQEANAFIQFFGAEKKDKTSGVSSFEVQTVFFQSPTKIVKTCPIIKYDLATFFECAKRAVSFDEDIKLGLTKRITEHFGDLSTNILSEFKKFCSTLFNLNATVSQAAAIAEEAKDVDGKSASKLMEDNKPTDTVLYEAFEQKISKKEPEHTYTKLITDVLTSELESTMAMAGGGESELEKHYKDPVTSPLAIAFNAAIDAALAIVTITDALKAENAGVVNVVYFPTGEITDPDYAKSSEELDEELLPSEDEPISELQKLDLSMIGKPKSQKRNVPSKLAPTVIEVVPNRMASYNDPTISKSLLANENSVLVDEANEPRLPYNENPRLVEPVSGGAYVVRPRSGGPVFFSDYDDVHQIDSINEVITNVKGFFKVYGEPELPAAAAAAAAAAGAAAPIRIGEAKAIKSANATTAEAEAAAKAEYLRGKPKTTSAYFQRQIIALLSVIKQNGSPDLTRGGYDIRMTNWWKGFTTAPFSFSADFANLNLYEEAKYNEIFNHKDQSPAKPGLAALADRAKYVRDNFDPENTFYYVKLAFNQRLREITEKVKNLKELYFTRTTEGRIEIQDLPDSSKRAQDAQRIIKDEMKLISIILTQILLYDAFAVYFINNEIYKKYKNVRDKWEQAIVGKPALAGAAAVPGLLDKIKGLLDGGALTNLEMKSAFDGISAPIVALVRSRFIIKDSPLPAGSSAFEAPHVSEDLIDAVALPDAAKPAIIAAAVAKVAEFENDIEVKETADNVKITADIAAGGHAGGRRRKSHKKRKSQHRKSHKNRK